MKEKLGGGEVEYYNDLPGKSPPEFSSGIKVQSAIGGVQDTGSSTHLRDRGTGFRQRPFRGEEQLYFRVLKMTYRILIFQIITAYRYILVSMVI